MNSEITIEKFKWTQKLPLTTPTGHWAESVIARAGQAVASRIFICPR